MFTFSIITPSFNQANYIEETINSIWSQKGNFKIEHIVMDGGSTDETVKILKNYEKRWKANKYPLHYKGLTFFWQSKKDNGQSDAINQGLKRSIGDILAYINSDDCYEPGAFQTVAEAFKTQTADLVYGECQFIDQHSKPMGKFEARPFIRDSYINAKNYIPQPTVFFTRQLYQSIGEFNPHYHYAMDYDYYLRAAKQFKIHYLQGKTLAQFRLHSNAKSIAFQAKSWQEARKIQLKHGGTFFSPAFLSYYRQQLHTFFQRFGIDLETYLLKLSKIKEKMREH